jgi:hypothetical protein
MVQVPAPSKLTVEPWTEQTDGVAEEKVTGSPEDALATTA